MHRLAHWLSNTFIALSFGLCLFLIAHITPTTHSDRWIYYSIYTTHPTICDFDIEFGRLGKSRPFLRTRPDTSISSPNKNFDTRASLGPYAAEENYARKIDWHFAGITLTEGQIIPPWGWRSREHFDFTTVIPYHVLSIPIFYAIALSGAIPALWLAARFRRHERIRTRAAAGLCIHCGYDLRATPNICPECGTPRMLLHGQLSSN